MTHDQIVMVLKMNGFVKKGYCGLSTTRAAGHSPGQCFSFHWVRQHPKKDRLQHIYIFEKCDEQWMTIARRKACNEWINQRNEKMLVSRNLEIPPADFLDAMELCP